MKDLGSQLERLHPDAFGWSLACCDFDPVEAEEALQASYLKVIEGRARFDGHSSVKTWLFGVIRRTAAEQRRTARRLRRALLRWWSAPGAETTDPGPGAALERFEHLGALAAALGKLSPRQRQVLTLVFWHEMTVDDAAAVLGIGSGSARVHYQRGKQRLRRLLRDRPDRAVPVRPREET